MTYGYCHDCYSAMMKKLEEITFQKSSQSSSESGDKPTTTEQNYKKMQDDD